MEAQITFRVYDEIWFEMSIEDREYFKHLKDEEDLELMKYKESFAFKFDFDVTAHTVNKAASLLLPGLTLENLTQVTFTGNEDSVPIFVSNSLLASGFSAQKSGRKLYCYFYIKPALEYFPMSNTVVLDKEAFNKVEKLEQSLDKL